MKNYIKKVIKTTVIHFISLSLAIAIFFSIAYAAISRPSSTPSGETAGWKFMAYFNNMFTSCSNWDVILWYWANWVKICWEVWSDWIIDNSLAQNDIANNAIWNGEMRDNAIWSNEVINNSLTQSDIADNAIWNWEMRNNSIWNDEMKDNAIWSNEVINWSLTLSDIDQANFDTRYLNSTWVWQFWWMYRSFGGFCQSRNPFTNSCSCPSWYSQKEIYTEYDWSSDWCWWAWCPDTIVYYCYK